MMYREYLVPRKLISYRSSILEGGFSAAAVLISVGGVLGKLNPFQVLCMAIVEAAMFVLNSYIGYTVLSVIDVGKKNDKHKICMASIVSTFPS